MSRAMAVQVITLLLIFISFAPSLVFGELNLPSIVTCTGAPGSPTPCTVCHLMQAAQNVLNVGIFVAIFLSSLLFAWAGVLYLTQSANIGEQGKARKLFRTVLFGLLLILAAWLIIDTLMKILVDPNKVISTSSGIRIGPWNEICG